MRPITRDVKLRSQANRNNTTGVPTKTQFAPNSALSGKEDAQTFQNTINIGSFINEINNQKQENDTNSMVNTGTQGSIEQIKVAQQLQKEQQKASQNEGYYTAPANPVKATMYINDGPP